MINATIQSLKPYVKNRSDFYTAILPNSGLTPKETLDRIIYTQKPVRGVYYCYFVNRS